MWERGTDSTLNQQDIFVASVKKVSVQTPLFEWHRQRAETVLRWQSQLICTGCWTRTVGGRGGHVSLNDGQKKNNKKLVHSQLTFPPAHAWWCSPCWSEWCFLQTCPSDCHWSSARWAALYGWRIWSTKRDNSFRSTRFFSAHLCC